MPKMKSPIFHKPHESSYIDLVRHTRPGNLVGYWPLNETSGTIAHDISGNGFHGTISGCLLGQRIKECPTPVFYFDGINDVVGLTNTTMLQRITIGSAFTIMAWAYIDEDVRFSLNPVQKRIFRFAKNSGNDWIQIRKNGSANQYTQIMIDYSSSSPVTTLIHRSYWYYPSQPLLDSYHMTYSTQTSNFSCYIGTFTTNRMYYPAFFMKELSSNTLRPTLSKFGVTLDTAAIGANNLSTPTEPWKGYIGHCAIWDADLSANEMMTLSSFELS